MLRFKDPQKVHGVIGDGVAIADDFLQIRIGGDRALFQGLATLLLDAEDRNPGTVLDREFIDRHCGLRRLRRAHPRRRCNNPRRHQSIACSRG